MKFAFALNSEKQFEKTHFGDTYQFLIYELIENKIVLISEEENISRLMDEDHEHGHGSKLKGQAIIDFLKAQGVNVLVSTQFGRNIKMVNKHFIPVIIYSNKPNEVISILEKHIHWIEDELKTKSDEYKLFTIKSGIMKSKIPK